MTGTLRTLLFSALVLVTTPLMADAPDDQYEPFDKNATEIRDTNTKLAWQRDKVLNRTKRTYANATATCMTFGGRIPTVKELLTLVDEAPHREYEFGANIDKAIDGAGGRAFASSTSVDAPYWTSTPTGEGGKRWALSFSDGTMVSVNENDATGFYVRCVK